MIRKSNNSVIKEYICYIEEDGSDPDMVEKFYKKIELLRSEGGVFQDGSTAKVIYIYYIFIYIFRCILIYKSFNIIIKYFFSYYLFLFFFFSLFQCELLKKNQFLTNNKKEEIDIYMLLLLKLRREESMLLENCVPQESIIFFFEIIIIDFIYDSFVFSVFNSFFLFFFFFFFFFRLLLRHLHRSKISSLDLSLPGQCITQTNE